MVLKEIKTESGTNIGKLYILGTVASILTLIINIIYSVKCLTDKTIDVHIETILINYLFVLSLLFKLPYLYSRVLSRLITIIMIIGFTIAGTIYLIAYTKGHKKKI